MGKLNIGDRGMIEAEGAFAASTTEMQMVVAMFMFLATIILAEGILDTILLASYAMEQAILLKGFEVSVEGYSVKLAIECFFYLGVREGIIFLDKDI